MTEQEKWELKLQEKTEILMSTVSDLVDIVKVMDANSWTSAEPANNARYSITHLDKFLRNDSPAANTHGVNLDKARYIP